MFFKMIYTFVSKTYIYIISLNNNEIYTYSKQFKKGSFVSLLMSKRTSFSKARWKNHTLTIQTYIQTNVGRGGRNTPKNFKIFLPPPK